MAERPATPPPSETSEPASIRDLARANDPFSHACVLIVDDQLSNVRVLERLLRTEGVSTIHSVTDARDAVARCLDVQPDVVLLDVHMPHIDGCTVLTSLRRALPADAFLPVLMITADAAREVRERALDAGANDFLTKPFDALEVVQRVRNLLMTRALYQAVKRRNAELQAELDAHAQERRRAHAEGTLRRERVTGAIADRCIQMAYQPIVDLADGRTIGVEALARFDRDPPRTPEMWFSDAAESGLAVDLDLAAMRAALEAVDHLPPGAFLSINSSPVTATSRAAHDLLRQAPRDRIVLELTEHSRVDNYDALRAALDDLRRDGVRVAVDDAGAGYAGLRQILRLRPDIIKLDVELTRDIDGDPVRRALAASLLNFGHDTGALIFAEGIETSEEHETLRRLGVRWGQGYHLARPGPLPIPSAVPIGHAPEPGGC